MLTNHVKCCMESPFQIDFFSSLMRMILRWPAETLFDDEYVN